MTKTKATTAAAGAQRKKPGRAKKQTAIIIGAGPAGLTAAYELATKTNITPIVFEASDDIGGISKTVNYKGNRIDIGGHRFFSKSDTVMQWWNQILPIEETPASKTFRMKYRGQEADLQGGPGPDPTKTDDVMLVRSRLSRIYYGRKFYDYPISLNKATIKKLMNQTSRAFTLTVLVASSTTLSLPATPKSCGVYRHAKLILAGAPSASKA